MNKLHGLFGRFAIIVLIFKLASIVITAEITMRMGEAEGVFGVLFVEILRKYFFLVVWVFWRVFFVDFFRLLATNARDRTKSLHSSRPS